MEISKIENCMSMLQSHTCNLSQERMLAFGGIQVFVAFSCPSVYHINLGCLSLNPSEPGDWLM